MTRFHAYPHLFMQQRPYKRKKCLDKYNRFGEEDPQRKHLYYCLKHNVFLPIRKKYPKNYDSKVTEIRVMSGALWSLQSNRQQDPVLNKKVKKIIKENPELNYQKTVH